MPATPPTIPGALPLEKPTIISTISPANTAPKITTSGSEITRSIRNRRHAARDQPRRNPWRYTDLLAAVLIVVDHADQGGLTDVTQEGEDHGGHQDDHKDHHGDNDHRTGQLRRPALVDHVLEILRHFPEGFPEAPVEHLALGRVAVVLETHTGIGTAAGRTARRGGQRQDEAKYPQGTVGPTGFAMIVSKYWNGS